MRFLIALALAAGTIAQTVVPVEQEPQHRLTFANAYVKVLEVTFPPGYVTLWHRHSNDNIGIRVTTGTTRTDTQVSEGAPRESPAGTVNFFSGNPPYTHRVANVGTTVVRVVDVELVGGKMVADSRATDDRGEHTLVLENDRVRISRVQLSEGVSLPVHTHQRGWLEVNIGGAQPGQFIWRDAGSRAAAISGLRDIIEVEVK